MNRTAEIQIVPKKPGRREQFQNVSWNLSERLKKYVKLKIILYFSHLNHLFRANYKKTINEQISFMMIFFLIRIEKECASNED